jgi:hypothetical protein
MTELNRQMKLFVDRIHCLPRIWSNRELARLAGWFPGDVVNVSAWRDEDKEGRHYRDYFTAATHYNLTNYKPEMRGFQGAPGGLRRSQGGHPRHPEGAELALPLSAARRDPDTAPALAEIHVPAAQAVACPLSVGIAAERRNPPDGGPSGQRSRCGGGSRAVS